MSARAQILDTRNIFERALQSYFAGHGLACYRTRSTENVPDARVVIAAQIQGTEHKCRPVDSKTGWHEQDMFVAQLSITIHSDRAEDETPPSNFDSVHDYRVALVRSLMLHGEINGQLDPEKAMVLPYHTMPSIIFRGEQTEAAEQGYDTTVLTYEIMLQIRADAWPNLIGN